MAIRPEVLDALLAAGATAEMIVAAVKADVEKDAADLEAKAVIRRKKDADRQRRHRLSRVTDCDGMLDGVTECDVSSPKERPPTPPKEITPSSSSLRSDTLRARGAFSEFRKIYPKRTGSQPWGPAEAKFLAIVKSGVDPDDILRGAAAYAAAMAGEDARFVAQAQTWLNQKRWRDDHQPAPPSRAGPPQRETGGSALLEIINGGFTQGLERNGLFDDASQGYDTGAPKRIGGGSG